MIYYHQHLTAKADIGSGQVVKAVQLSGKPILLSKHGRYHNNKSFLMHPLKVKLPVPDKVPSYKKPHASTGGIVQYS